MVNIQTLGRYPVGDSSFTKIREKGQIYVDKTDLIYRVTHDTDYNFLSRPRRFGKSLMLSTLTAYFEARKDLFEGLAIYELEKDWKKHPVINISMGHDDIKNLDILESYLSIEIEKNANKLGVDITRNTPATQFIELIIKASEKYGERVVVLIDEYDKHILDTRHISEDLHEGVKRVLRGFYGCIKECADYLRFVMITGVTKFSHVNIFSGLNNLKDISLRTEYNSLCGISQSEMERYFAPDMAIFAQRNGLSIEQAYSKFKQHYDGYRFAAFGENIYNPYSVVNAFDAMKFSNYWFSTGTSYYLVKEMEGKNYDFLKLENITANEDDLMGVSVSENNITALLYQAGYLTIKDYDSEGERYKLGFPNKEVSSGFFNNLLNLSVSENAENKFSATLVYGAAIDGKPEDMMKLFKSALSQYTYPQIEANVTEKHFNLLMYTISMAIGLNVRSEVNTSRGRIDMTIETRKYVYLMEFKINSYPKRALDQINEKGYADKFFGDTRTIFKIGANFSSKTLNLTGWIIQPQ